MKVYQFKICVDFYGPRPTHFKSVFVVASNYDVALDILCSNHKEIYSIEFVSENDVLLSKLK